MLIPSRNQSFVIKFFIYLIYYIGSILLNTVFEILFLSRYKFSVINYFFLIKFQFLYRSEIIVSEKKKTRPYHTDVFENLFSDHKKKFNPKQRYIDFLIIFSY